MRIGVSVWLSRSAAATLARAGQRAAAALGIRQLRGQRLQEDDVEWRENFQRALAAALRPGLGHVRAFARGRLGRWTSEVLPVRRAATFIDFIGHVSGLAPPRVAAACRRTVFNGWCAGRRFQQRGCCVLGCPLAADSLERLPRAAPRAARARRGRGLRRLLRLGARPGLGVR
ncbi:unnamed protein product [Prorocentrum cordatum]|uniref:Uncharacterized protein n=1 Tax=Prorocentrum cordatum TaxID=2364126 RepID=A0ABN9TQ31_9DINO|nr:unnamed protein product [Polarella glacialis]